MKNLALIPLLLIGATSQAATIEIGTPSYIRPVGGDLYYFPADERAPPRLAWPGMENNPRDISAPTSKGRVPITLNQKSPVALNKLAGPVLNLAKRVGPLGLGLTAAGLVCEFTEICSGPSDPDNPASSPVWTKPNPLNEPFTYQRYKAESFYGGLEASTAWPVCESAIAYQWASIGGGGPNSGIQSYEIQTCTVNESFQTVNAGVKYIRKDGTSYTQTIQVGSRIQGCPSTHVQDGNMCRPANQLPRLPVLPGDWPAPETVPDLNTPDVIPDLIEGGEPIPVDTPSIDPKTIPSPSGSTTETIRNGAGEPIGTKTTDTTVTVSPSGPTTVNVTETTTITETNITNNTTTTTTQETTLPNSEDQTEKPKEDTDLDIDDVPDSDLQEYEIPDTFTYDSWGGGSCPGNPTIPALGRSYSLPVDKVCDAMVNFRPVVLLIAALVSAYIISGAFRQ